MSVGEYCNREVVMVERTDTLEATINLLRQHHVGDVVVVSRDNQQVKPIGIVTDRDIVLEVLAQDVDPEAVTVGDIMSFELLTLQEHTSLLDALQLMRQRGVRRAPVVNASNELTGILAVDDVLELLAEALTDIVTLLRNEQEHERRRRC
jgi:CBS domain-containing protein